MKLNGLFVGLFSVFICASVTAERYAMPSPVPLRVQMPNQFDPDKFQKEVDAERASSGKNFEEWKKQMEQGNEGALRSAKVAEKIISRDPTLERATQEVKGEEGEKAGKSGGGKKVAQCDCYDQKQASNFPSNFILDDKHQERLYRINPFCECLKRDEKLLLEQSVVNRNLPKPASEDQRVSGSDDSVQSPSTEKPLMPTQPVSPVNTAPPTKGEQPAWNQGQKKLNNQPQQGWNINY